MIKRQRIDTISIGCAVIYSTLIGELSIYLKKNSNYTLKDNFNAERGLGNLINKIQNKKQN